ncbi:MAG: hypothetical protein IPJ74_25115 [Saprospiraceae bacterium]|nr:hypothetical protein [Saprospiraceae bacterium]
MNKYSSATNLIRVFQINLFIFCAYDFDCGSGLYGLIAVIASFRVREIGIRRVLGATVNNIVILLSRIFYLVLVATLLAFPLAWWAIHKWLQDFAYRIDIQWWMFVIAGMSALAIALITVGLQSIRAAVANPVESLRSE